MRKFHIKVNGIPYEVEVEEAAAGAVFAPQPTVPAAAPAAAPAQAAPTVAQAPAAPAPAPAPAAAPVGGEQIKAPMPGTVLSIKTSVGAQVKRGDVLLILEAMKMENEIVAPKDGSVAQILVQAGASVNSGDAMVVLQ